MSVGTRLEPAQPFDSNRQAVASLRNLGFRFLLQLVLFLMFFCMPSIHYFRTMATRDR